MDIDYTKISEQDIKLTSEEANFLGPELVLENCTINSNCDRDTLTIAGLTMIGGDFIQHARLSDFHFSRAHLINVKFTGNFIGCDYGDWEKLDRSSVSGCDFSEAILDGCRFLNCDMHGIQLPKWPNFAILNPINARSVVLSRKWPSEIGITLDVYTDNDPECVAICGNAEILAKEDKISLDDLRELLMTLPGINIQD